MAGVRIPKRTLISYVLEHINFFFFSEIILFKDLQFYGKQEIYYKKMIKNRESLLTLPLLYYFI